MRYLETQETSAELLRLALPLMTRQDAAFHPLSYTLWYEHLSGINPALSQCLTIRLAANSPLTEEDVYRLYQHHIIKRDLEKHESWQEKVRGLLGEVVHAAINVADDSAEFGRKLGLHQAQLRTVTSLDHATRAVGEVLEETRQMQSCVEWLSQQLCAKTEQFEELALRLVQAQAEALLDPLCGLKNRRGFERAVTEVFASDSAGSVALLMADVDHFKQLNDTYGHLLGDKVLRTVAQTMQLNIKGRDIAARLGGDEFSLLLPQTTLSGARALAEQIRSAVAGGRIQRGDGQSVRGGVTVSIGVAMGTAAEGIEAVMVRADAALYQAKRGGRNRICVAESA
jgi:diguanylate cyclase